MKRKTTKPTRRERERLRLLADRLCYEARGMDGLRTRHGMQWAYAAVREKYTDEWDEKAEKIRAGALPQDAPSTHEQNEEADALSTQADGGTL